jgi:hypothetical protein
MMTAASRPRSGSENLRRSNARVPVESSPREQGPNRPDLSMANVPDVDTGPSGPCRAPSSRRSRVLLRYERQPAGNLSSPEDAKRLPLEQDLTLLRA